MTSVQDPFGPEEMRLALLAALLLPLAACSFQGAKKKEVLLPAHIVQESIKWKLQGRRGCCQPARSRTRPATCAPCAAGDCDNSSVCTDAAQLALPATRQSNVGVL